MLEKQLYAGKDPALVRENLRANSCKIMAEESYHRQLTDDEITAHRAKAVDCMIKVESINEQIKDYTDQKKAERKPYEEQQKESTYAVKTGLLQVKGDLYMIDDQDNRMMGFYDATGRLIKERPLLPEERQINFISRMHRAANDL